MQGVEGEGPQSSGLDAEENMGISSPLYQIIDVVFDLRARGFLRRQVCNSSTALAHSLCHTDPRNVVPHRFTHGPCITTFARSCQYARLICALAVHQPSTHADIVVISRDLVLMLCRLLVWLARCYLLWLAVP